MKLNQRLWRQHITNKPSKTNVKKRQHIIRVIKQYSLTTINIGTSKLEKAEKIKMRVPQMQENCQAERSSRIGNITFLMNIRGEFLRPLQGWLTVKLWKKKTLKNAPKTTETVLEYASYRPQHLALFKQNSRSKMKYP
jgi:hypothetical protein